MAGFMGFDLASAGFPDLKLGIVDLLASVPVHAHAVSGAVDEMLLKQRRIHQPVWEFVRHNQDVLQEHVHNQADSHSYRAHATIGRLGFSLLVKRSEYRMNAQNDTSHEATLRAEP